MVHGLPGVQQRLRPPAHGGPHLLAPPPGAQPILPGPGLRGLGGGGPGLAAPGPGDGGPRPRGAVVLLAGLGLPAAPAPGLRIARGGRARPYRSAELKWKWKCAYFFVISVWLKGGRP